MIALQMASSSASLAPKILERGVGFLWIAALGAAGAVGDAKTKKPDVVEHPEIFDHVGLLGDEPSSDAGMLFI